MDRGAVIGAIVLGGLAVFGYFRMFTSGRGRDRLKEVLANARVIDVRSNAEYREGHFNGALNIPLDKLAKSRKKLGSLEEPIVVYCASGSRARQAVRILKSMGFRSVINGVNKERLSSLA